MTNEELAMMRLLDIVAELKSEVETLRAEVRELKQGTHRQIEFDYYTSGGTAQNLSFYASTPGTPDGSSTR